jgi:hypothetical protein
VAETGINSADVLQIFDWLVEIRRAKLHDPAVIGNADSFFKKKSRRRAQKCNKARMAECPCFRSSAGD